MENRRCLLVFLTVFLLNVGISDCQIFQDVVIENIINTFSSQCEVPDWNPAEKYIKPQRLKIHFYSQGKFHIYPILSAPARLEKSPNFNPELKTVIFVNGFRCPPDEKIIADLGEAFAKHGGVNFLLYNFYTYAKGEIIKYFELVKHTSPLSKHLGNFLIGLTEHGVSRKNIHLIGYSYGAQLSGVAGLFYRQALGKPIARITALDPTTVCFPQSINIRLRPRSAKFIDSIQTSVLSSGVVDMGQVNFIVNNNVQPGCENDLILCVHARSVQLYVESIFNQENLLAIQCTNWDEFINGRCHNNTISPIGYNLRTDIKGNFFIKTGGKSPYGIGLRGIN